MYTFKSLPVALRVSRRDFLAGTAATTVIVLYLSSARPIADQAHIRITEMTGLHLHMYPHDDKADKSADTVCLACSATLIHRVRSEATNSMLIDNGDFLPCNPLADYIACKREMKDGDMHLIISAMSTPEVASGSCLRATGRPEIRQASCTDRNCGFGT